MEEEKKRLISWVKAHRKELLLLGISIVTIIGIIIGIKNKDEIDKLWNTLENCIIKAPKKLPETITKAEIASPVIDKIIPIREYTSPQKPFDVSQHIRNLPTGRFHSFEKSAEAKKLGIELLPHQTLVDTYTKYNLENKTKVL